MKSSDGTAIAKASPAAAAELVPVWREALVGAGAEEIVDWAQRTFPRLAFATSLGLEDQALTDLISRRGKGIDFFLNLSAPNYDLSGQESIAGACTKVEVGMGAVAK